MTTQEQIKALQAQLQALKSEVPSSKINGLTVKIGEKGNILIYGLQRFPVSLYPNQVEKLTALFNNQELSKFIEVNKSKLAVKGE
jgi:hypothetical protein